MRRAAFALLSFCMLGSLVLFGGPAQAGGYGYGGGVVVGGYAGGGYVGGGYYGPGRGWGGAGCGRRVRRGLFAGCGAYYPRPRVRYYVAPPPPVYYAPPRRRCPLVPRLDGRGGWIWAPNAACE